MRQVLGARVHRHRSRPGDFSDGHDRSAAGRSAAPAGRCSAQLGAPALLVPERRGGLGLSDVDLVGVLEEAGWAALPEPLLETAGLAAPLLAAAGCPRPSAADALARSWPASALVAVGGDRRRRRRDRRRPPPCSAGRHGAHRRGWSGRATPRLFLLACPRPRTRAGSCTPSPPMLPGACHAQRSTRPATCRTVTGRCRPTRLLAYGRGGRSQRRAAGRSGAAGSAALLIGLADRMITLAADYAKERHQFGKPIGSFQAVKHLLANARVKLEFARPATYRAAWSLATAQPERLPRRLHGQGHGVRRRRPGRPGRPAGPRGHRLHLGVRPPFLHEADLGPLGRLGGRRHPPATWCPRHRPWQHATASDSARPTARTAMSDFRQ